MSDAETVAATIRLAWSRIPPPPAEDLKYLSWACGEDAWRTLVNVAPVAVDTSAAGFLGCTPLLDLPPRAAAAYLGPYLLSLIEGLKFQSENGVFYDILTRAHVITCLSDADFWNGVIRTHLPADCREALVELSALLASYREMMALPDGQLAQIADLANGHSPPAA